jgi:hypothetical protein
VIFDAAFSCIFFRKNIHIKISCQFIVSLFVRANAYTQIFECEKFKIRKIDIMENVRCPLSLLHSQNDDDREIAETSGSLISLTSNAENNHGLIFAHGAADHPKNMGGTNVQRTASAAAPAPVAI